MTAKETAFTHLRPTTTPEMLDRALAAAVRFAPLLWAAALVYSADHLLPLFISGLPESEATTPALAAALLGLMLAGEYVSAVSYLALFQAMLFPLRPAAPKALLRTALRKLPGFFFTHFLYISTVAMSAMILWGFFTARTGATYFPIRMFAAAAAGSAALWITIRLSLAPIACLIEDCNPFRAFGRSWHLTSSRAAVGHSRYDIPALRWLAIAALPALVSLVLATSLIIYLHGQLGVNWPVDWKSDNVSWALNLFFFAAIFIAAPLYWAGLMALYVEYRMRHEALDFYLRLRERRRELNKDPLDSSAKSH